MRFLWFHALELIVFFLAVLFLSDLKKFRLGGFAIYMFLVCVTELSASNSAFFGLKTNSPIYNCYILVSLLIVMYIFLGLLNYKGLVKKIYITCCSAAIIFMLFDMVCIQGLMIFDSYGNIVVAFFEIILSVLLVGKLFLDDDDEVSILNNPYFWIAAGTLIFNMGSLVTMGLIQYIALKNIRIGGIILYRIIMPILIGIVYTCYGYSFILCRKLTTRLSQS